MVCAHLFLVCEVSNVLTNNFKHHALSGSEWKLACPICGLRGW